MRLDKFLSDMNIGTRKEIRKKISRKEITVEGVVAKEGKLQVQEDTAVCINGKAIRYKKYRYFILNKPANCLSATRDGKQKTVLDLLDAKDRVKNLHPIGRLDKDTTGLLVLTNDGDLTHRLLSPKKHVPKVYEVHTAKPVTEELIHRFQEGIYFEKEDITTTPAEVIILSSCVAEVTIYEGKFHQIKRMFALCENEVLQLKRIRMNNLSLPQDLKEGGYRELTAEEFQELSEGN